MVLDRESLWQIIIWIFYLQNRLYLQLLWRDETFYSFSVIALPLAFTASYTAPTASSNAVDLKGVT